MDVNAFTCPTSCGFGQSRTVAVESQMKNLTTDFTDFTDVQTCSQSFPNCWPCWSPDDSFPSQGRFLEIQEQSYLQAGDVQVAEHLGDVRFVERAHHLRVSYYLAVHD